jgi:hypothetical protein
VYCAGEGKFIAAWKGERIWMKMNAAEKEREREKDRENIETQKADSKRREI